jgi:hypothetical protein
MVVEEVAVLHAAMIGGAIVSVLVVPSLQTPQVAVAAPQRAQLHGGLDITSHLVEVTLERSDARISVCKP